MKKRREIDRKVFGENLRFYRRDRGFTLEQVKEYLCLGSVQAIYKWESGKCFPQADTLIALTELYEVEPKDLMERRWRRDFDFVFYPLPELAEAEKRAPFLIAMRNTYSTFAYVWPPRKEEVAI